MAQRQSHKNAPKNANNAPTYAHVTAGNAGPGGQPQAQPSHEAPPASSNPTGQTIGCDSVILAAPAGMPPTSGAGQPPPPPAVNPDDRVSVLGRRLVPLPGSDAQPQDASQGAVPAHSEKPPPAAHPGTRETNGYRFIKAESSQSEDASQGAMPAPSAGNPAHSEKQPPAGNPAPRTGKGHRVLEQDSSQPEDASQGAVPAPPAAPSAANPAPSAANPPPPAESLSQSEQSSSGSTSKDGSKLPPPVMLYFPVSKELVRATMKIVKEGGAFKYLSVRFFVYPKGKSASYKDIFGDLLHWRSDGKKGKRGKQGAMPKEPIVYRKRPLYLKIGRENLCYMMQTQTEITLCLVTGGAGGQARLFTRLIFLSPRNLPHYRGVFGELKSQFSSKPLPGEFAQLSGKSGAGKVAYALTNEAAAGGEGAYYREMYKNYLFSGYRRQMDKLAHRLIKPKHGGGEAELPDEPDEAEAPEQAGAGKKAKKGKAKPKDATQDKGNFEHLYFEYIKAERKHPWFRGHVPMLTWDDPKVVLAKAGAPAQVKEASAGDWKSKGQVYFSRSETWHPLVGFKFNADPNPKPVPGQFQAQQAQQQQAQQQAAQQGQQVPGKRPPRRNRFTRPNFDFTFEYKIGDQVVTQVVNYLHIEYYKMTAIPGYNSLTVHILHMMQCIHFQFEQYEHCAAMYEELKGWLGKPDRIDINLNAGRIYKALNPGLVGPKAPPPHPEGALTPGASPHTAQGPKKGLTKEKLNELIHEACYPAGAAHPPSCIEYGTTRDRFSCAPKPKPGDASQASPVSSPAPGPNGRGVSPGGSESGFNGKRKLTRREVAHNRTCALIVLDIKRTLRQLLNRLAHAQLEESTAPNATSLDPKPGQEVYDDKVVVLKAGQEALKGKYAEVRNILRKFYATAPESFVIFPKERTSEAPSPVKAEPETSKGSDDASKKKGSKKEAPKKPFFNHKPQYEWLYQGLTAPF